MNMGSTAVRRLNDYVSALSYHWRKKQNKTKLNSERLYNIRLIKFVLTSQKL